MRAAVAYEGITPHEGKPAWPCGSEELTAARLRPRRHYPCLRLPIGHLQNFRNVLSFGFVQRAHSSQVSVRLGSS